MKVYIDSRRMDNKRINKKHKYLIAVEKDEPNHNSLTYGSIIIFFDATPYWHTKLKKNDMVKINRKGFIVKANNNKDFFGLFIRKLNKKEVIFFNTPQKERTIDDYEGLP